MNNKIIFKKDKRPPQNYFSMAMCLITILLLVFQVVANRHISKAGKKFVETQRAKQLELRSKARKAEMDRILQNSRMEKQKAEEEYLSAIEGKTKRQEGHRLETVKQGMDYQRKLEIYNNAHNARKGVKQK